ncbi:MAG: LapA family protein [Chrysiogenales bacterium]|nr:MAG: LapA family protein [Chrysiogenales bacterium]
MWACSQDFFGFIDFSGGLRHNPAAGYGGNMRTFYFFLLILLVAVTTLFALQNLQTITVSFVSWSVTLPIAAVVAGTYALGMVSGGSLLAFLRWTLTRAKKTG